VRAGGPAAFRIDKATALPETEEVVVGNFGEDMLAARRLTHLITAIVALLLAGYPAGAPARAAMVTAKAAVLIDQDTGAVLWQRNPDLPLPPASTTKIVTAIVALQSNRLDEPLLVSRQAAQAPPSKVSLQPGWRMELRDLVYAILLNSANDASVVIAEGLAGSVPSFAQRMNAYARRVGAYNTHFVNPNGLPAEDHYASARDLATLFGHALRNPEFSRIVHTKTTVVTPTSGSRRSILLRNKNRLLHDYHIDVVGKTGWTRAAKKCFVGAGFANGRELLVAVLGSNDLWGDLRTLLEFGLDGGPMPEPENAFMIAARPSERTRSAPNVTEQGARQGKRYAVRLATFKSLERAKRLHQSMVKKGYAARITTVRRNKTVLHQVSVGQYANREQALRVAHRIGRANPSLKVIVDAVG
jgi:D-alanyl-D-alanine carboxypeptidase (penicillin-binding protein 5/6)